LASRWGKLGGQSVGGVGGGGGPQRGYRAHGPHRIGPLCTLKPRPLPLATAPRKSGKWGSRGRSVGGRRWPVPPLWPEGQSGSGDASRPKATIGWCGGGGVGGQRLHVAKSVLGGQSGEGRAKASPSRPFVASGWPEWGGAKASRLWPSLCGQWVAGVGPPCMASRWPVRGRGAPFPMGGRPLLWPVGGRWP
jgi:hypothetical protein